MVNLEVLREFREEVKVYDMYLYLIDKDIYELFFGL